MIGYIVVIAISLVVLIVFGRQILQGLKSRNWPTAAGTVQDARIQMHQSTDEEGDVTTTYEAFVQYRYSVSGREYQGMRRTFSDVRTSSRSRTEKILERYPPGGSVTVYYDPEDPSASVLEPGVGAMSYILLLLVLAFLVFGVVGLLGILG
jgi:hypothetical protein